MSSFEFSHSGCTWCHPGGGPLEYDRDGYRYDGRASGLVAGGLSNPSPKPGDYFAFDPNTKSLVDKSAAWVSGGVAEIDCYMCHLVTPATPTTLNADYRNLERNFGDGSPGTTAPSARASYGLANTGLLENVTLGQPNVNPSVTSFVWSAAFDSATVPGADVTTATANQGPPTKESCAQCHFPDKGNTTVAALPKGPAGNPLGFTSWQKYIPANTTGQSVIDADYVGGTTLNQVEWKLAKGRAEGGKRGESINDPLNPDVHMDRGMTCWDCHYLLGRDATKSEILGDGIGNEDGICNANEACTAELEPDPLGKHTYPALLDASGAVVQPSLEVWKIDHQFAKGDNTPDGKNMDQLDNTVTCASCHIDRTHPNAGLAPDPSAAHSGFPAFHFDKINCKTCHIPYVNGPVEQVLADFTVGPYRTFERSQVNSQPATGVGQRPLYLQRATEHGTGHVEVQPFGLLSVAVWANAVTQVGEECGQIAPTFQRLAKGAAEARRIAYGSTDGVTYDWKLNAAQNGDTTLIVNTPQEISDMVGQLITTSGNPSLRPVMHFFFNQFAISHNVRPKGAASNMILGSAAGGGCVMCHSSSDPASPNYSPVSVGFFDKSVLLFNQPTDGGNGLVQTTLTDSVGTLERINIKFPYKMANGSSASVNLSNAAGQTVGNTVDQGEVLGYDPVYLAALKSPATAGVETPSARFSYAADTTVSRKVNFDASASICRPSTATCTNTWDFGGAGTADLTDPIKPSYTYAVAGTYTVKLSVSNGITAGTKSANVTAVNINAKPVINYTMTATGMDVQIVDSSTDADQPLKVQISWGDGTAVTGVGGDTFNKTYRFNGRYTISYRVTDSTGARSSTSFTVTVPQP